VLPAEFSPVLQKVHPSCRGFWRPAANIGSLLSREAIPTSREASAPGREGIITGREAPSCNRTGKPAAGNQFFEQGTNNLSREAPIM